MKMSSNTVHIIPGKILKDMWVSYIALIHFQQLFATTSWIPSAEREAIPSSGYTVMQDHAETCVIATVTVVYC